MWLAAWGDHGNSRRYVESFKVSALTVLDVPHVQMDARHQNTNSLGALVAQQLHHLRVEKRGVITQPYSYSSFRLRLQIKGHYSPLFTSWKPAKIRGIKFCLVELLVPLSASPSFHIHQALVIPINLPTNTTFPSGV